jgi:hypothetical protein
MFLNFGDDFGAIVCNKAYWSPLFLQMGGKGTAIMKADDVVEKKKQKV